jgi:hypothetical protein
MPIRGVERGEQGLNQIPESQKNTKKLIPVKQVAEVVPLSARRIRALLKSGKIAGELRLEEGYGQGLWYTSIAEVQKYKSELPSFAEFGKIGGKTAGRGRLLRTSK